MSDDKEKSGEGNQEIKKISDKTWDDDDDWMNDPSGINPGC